MHRENEVAHDGRYRWNDEQEHHHDPVHREDLVVGLRGHDVHSGINELVPDQHGKDAGDHEGRRDRDEIHQPDSLVIKREQPRLEALVVVQVMNRRWGGVPGN